MTMLDRRVFLRGAGAAALAGKTRLLAAAVPGDGQGRSANDQINLALVGAGGQGQGDTRTALQVPGVKLVAVADCYDGRLAHAKELWGADVFTTRDYQEILTRKDVDAVLVATPDHWHKQASIDAMNAGKDVYCEKPMIHLYADGHAMIDVAKKTGRILQIGSQRVSNVLYAKAQELLAAGAIGCGLKGRRRRWRGMRRGSFNGGSGRTMGRAFRGICLCICSAGRTSLRGRMGLRGGWPRADCGIGRMGGMWTM